MYAIEFETSIEGNLVKLPMTDAKPLAGQIKIIVLPFSREEIYAAR